MPHILLLLQKLRGISGTFLTEHLIFFLIMQSIFKFDWRINDKCVKSRKLLGGIKHLMYDGRKEVEPVGLQNFM